MFHVERDPSAKTRWGRPLGFPGGGGRRRVASDEGVPLSVPWGHNHKKFWGKKFVEKFLRGFKRLNVSWAEGP